MVKFWRTFSSRTDDEELMDDMDLAGEQLQSALRQLHLINRFLGGYQITFKGISHLVRSRASTKEDEDLLIADLGCGGGHTLKEMARWCRRKKIKASFLGVDANLATLNFAREVCRDYPEVQFEQCDILSEDFLNRNFDIISCNLLLHHFDDQLLVSYIPRLLSQAKGGLVINDLQRHPLPFILFSLITWILKASYMTRHDGLVSIRRGFKRKELKELFQDHSPGSIHISWQWAFRFLAIIQTHK